MVYRDFQWAIILHAHTHHIHTYNKALDKIYSSQQCKYNHSSNK